LEAVSVTRGNPSEEAITSTASGFFFFAAYPVSGTH
jgi:hypothetical protein